jgi:hypothetical protein
VLSLLGGLLLLVGAILCGTIILAPVGILVLLLARRLLRTAADLVVPREVRHPIESLTEAVNDTAEGAAKSVRKRAKRAKKKARSRAKQLT